MELITTFSVLFKIKSFICTIIYLRIFFFYLRYLGDIDIF